MKKRTTILLLLLLCLLIPTTAYAASTETVKAAISKLKMYFDGSQVNGKVLTYNKVNYVPVTLLTDKLGFKVSTSSKTNKMTITEKISKEDLQNEINSLSAKNSKLQSQITELNQRLRFYSGGEEDYTGQTSDDYFTRLQYATSMGSAVWPLKNNAFIKTSRNYDFATWYKIDVSEGKGLTVALKPQIDSGSMSIQLYSADGTLLSSKSYIGNGRYETVGYQAKNNSTVYVKVSGAKGIYYIGFYDQYYNSTSSQNDERDFFGTLNTSRKILNGDIDRADPKLEEWYRVDVKEGQTLSVNMIPQIDSGSMAIQLYSADGTLLSSKSYIGNGKYGTVTKKASTDCTYFIVITGPTGKYNLSYIIN